MYIAKPNSFNSLDTKEFKSAFDAADYLNSFSQTESKIDVESWIALGKLLDKSTGKIPEYYPAYKFDKVTRTRKLIMKKFSMEELV